MDRFVSNFKNRIDAKGRVSVPAGFRSVLTRQGDGGIYLYPALGAPAIDAGGQAMLDKVAALLEDVAPFSDEMDTLSTAIFGDAVALNIDADGRIILPEALRAHASIEDFVTFVGLGGKFQLWEPGRFAAHQAKARARVRDYLESFGAAKAGREA